MRFKLVVAGAAVALAACGTVSDMEPTGGSRSDGIVRLSYEYGMFNKVQLDAQSGLQKARQRCAVWGYTDADPFGGVVRQCQAMSTYGCTHWFATIEYQCTMGGGNAPALSESSASAAPMMPPPMAGPNAMRATGPRLVRANTQSGYCVDVPSDYVATGAANSPYITAATPRCDQLSAH